MSLLKEFARPCTIMVQTREPDGEGGWHTVWTEGTAFENYQALASSAEVRRAEQQGISGQYDVLVDQSVPISYNDFFRDDRNGQTYRVTSEPADKMSPGSASFCLKYYTAEKRELPE